MIGTFDEYLCELPPFQEYWEETFRKRQMLVIARESGTKVAHYARLLNQLLSPTCVADSNTSHQVIKLSS